MNELFFPFIQVITTVYISLKKTEFLLYRVFTLKKRGLQITLQATFVKYPQSNALLYS